MGGWGEGGGLRNAALVPSLGCAARLAEEAEGKQARRRVERRITGSGASWLSCNYSCRSANVGHEGQGRNNI